MTEAVQSALTASDTHLYRRRSYDMFRSVFTGPGSERIGHAPIMNDTPKVLISTPAADSGWGQTTLVNGDVAAHSANSFQCGEERLAIGAGDIVIVPPGVARKFTNDGPGRSKLVCIHASPTFIGECLE